MLREANVGVGIHGREGNAAVRSADFSIRQFKNLVKLIAVHGRYCMVRNAGLNFS
jgi:phospholipid-transporting ATPase